MFTLEKYYKGLSVQYVSLTNIFSTFEIVQNNSLVIKRLNIEEKSYQQSQMNDNFLRKIKKLSASYDVRFKKMPNGLESMKMKIITRKPYKYVISRII